MFANKDTVWISPDRRTRLYYDQGTGMCSLFVDDVEALQVSDTEINPLLPLLTKRTIVADGASVALTREQSGALCIFDKSDGALFTLPAAEAGLEFEFRIVGTPSSVGHRVVCASGDFIVGSILLDDTDTGLTTSAQAANGTTHLAIDLDAATDGWLAGGFFTLTAISATQWSIAGHLIHTGNVASPFETS